jgi:hypothetical protein
MEMRGKDPADGRLLNKGSRAVRIAGGGDAMLYPPASFETLMKLFHTS